MKIQQNIKHNLRLAMAEKNVSLTEFANKLGIARSSLHDNAFHIINQLICRRRIFQTLRNVSNDAG